MKIGNFIPLSYEYQRKLLKKRNENNNFTLYKPLEYNKDL